MSLGYPKFDIVLNEKDSVELVAIKSASGIDKKEALYRAKQISYGVSQKDSLIEFNPQFDIQDGDKWRNQNLRVVLKIPVGTVVYLATNMKHIIHDIDNVTNTYDGDMVSRRWKMTSRGLECVDCDGLFDHVDNHKYDDVPAVPPIPESIEKEY
jgi:hypothetical protein